MSNVLWTAAQEVKRTPFRTLPIDLRGGNLCTYCSRDCATVCADCEWPVCRNCGTAHPRDCEGR